ncbi:MAG: hypothetical protein GC184_13855 [Rhizobiales bacterium]|nr:hypothetical protein [Hyphomicrobiales bacterium]
MIKTFPALKAAFVSSLFAIALVGPVMAAGLLDLDANKDGSISSAEAQSVIESQFDKMDANHDGQMSKAEYTDARLAELSRLDANNDGEITRSELREQLRAMRR